MKEKYLTVTALTKYLKRKMELDPHLQNIWLRGEISNFKLHSRGHMYLTIKDEETRIQAVMFAGSNRNLTFMPENGMNVLIRGTVAVFEAYGQYQLYITEMEPDGVGALYLAFEQLKTKLETEGYFLEERKKKIPEFPNHIGIITSPTGAAIRDILTTIKRRYPIVETTLLPVLVQGENAPYSIATAIREANELNMFDCLIVGRGGGSIEELWSFNEEIVAQAIYDSKIPIISAVGHETDITISDFVADLRAPTPTAAAELAVPSQVDLVKRNLEQSKRLQIASEKLVIDKYKHLSRLQKSYAFRYPKHLVAQKEQQLDTATDRLDRAFQLTFNQKNEQFATSKRRLHIQNPKEMLNQSGEAFLNIQDRFNRVMDQYLVRQRHEFTSLIEKLSLLNPLEIMKRGFAVPYKEDGTLIHSVTEVVPSDAITVVLNDGRIYCTVNEREEEAHHVGESRT